MEPIARIVGKTADCAVAAIIAAELTDRINRLRVNNAIVDRVNRPLYANSRVTRGRASRIFC